MRTLKRTWLTLLAAFCCLLPAYCAQPQPRNTATEYAGIQKAEADDNMASNTNDATATTPESAEPEKELGARQDKGTVWRAPMVVIGKSAVLNANDATETLVVVGGSAKVHGKVRDAAVAIGGDLEVDGEVGEAAVAVLGDVKALRGGKINGEAVAVGGKVDVAEGATVARQPQAVELPEMKWLRSYLLQCVFKLRPLAPQVRWLWGIVGATFLLYLLIAAVFQAPVRACVNELHFRPATTFLLGLITKLFVPLVILILIATGIGIIVVPFVVAALFLGAMVGKVALCEWVGMKLGRSFGSAALENPVPAFALGAVLVIILYMIPVLGLIALLIFSVWGLGCAVVAAFGGLRREMPQRPAPAPQPIAPEPAMAGAPSFATGAQFASEPAPPQEQASPRPPAVPTLEPPVMTDVLSYPKAGFWERTGAGFIDFVLVSILGVIVNGPPLAFLVALAYFAAMWAWRGTTIGGIVLGLKVTRFDGQPVTFAVALVRALAGAFSLVVLFLGFLWIAWDREKQGWHDKIAGTVVLKLPRGTPLLCL